MALQISQSVKQFRRVLAGTGIAMLLAMATLAPAAIAQETSQVSQSPTSEQQAAASDEQSESPTPSTDVNTNKEPQTVESKPTEQTSAAGSEAATTPAPNSQQTLAPDSPAAPSQRTSIEQNVTSTAASGSATVTDNTTAGNATSGSASANTTVVNIVHSASGASGLSGSTPVTFVHDITGDIQGDITIDPFSMLSQPAGTTSITVNDRSSSSSVDIVNNVDLTAASGSAVVADNGQAGDATSGNATALANVINLVSSSIGSARSFVGVINIHGNLTGDILVPSSFVDDLLLSNDDDTTVPPGQSGQGSLDEAVTITNNVKLEAVSGTAAATGNQSAGNALSGNALTNLKVYNLTGQQIVAKNSLLVFVNVLGEWVGMIVPAPNGSTSAVLGGGVMSSQQRGPTGNHQSTVNITNNVNVTAQSGGATVANNGQAGSARSGNATAGANILNMVHSSYNLDDWFGALFINVLGSWLGNFDIAPDETAAIQPPPIDRAAAFRAIREVRVFQFADDAAVTPTPALSEPTAINEAPVSDLADVATSRGAVLGQESSQPAPDAVPSSRSGLFAAALAAIGAGLGGMAVWAWRQRRATI